mmetsp:Transcript_41372/g.74585  ORF Transcript_41372/g.74585 Transcript_41372/m.74585 type:complete len:230 (+) Transcript_41372:359-1048(+)
MPNSLRRDALGWCFYTYGKGPWVRTAWVATPEKAIIASLQWVISFSFISSMYASDLPLSKPPSKPKSPGARPDPSNICRMAMKSMTSSKVNQRNICARPPCSTDASWAVAAVTPSSASGTGRTRRPQSTETHPSQAIMQMRPCLSSASRRKSTGAKSEKRKGSNPTFPTYPSQFGGDSRKGREADLAFTVVTARVVGAGANPAAEPATAARTASFIMVEGVGVGVGIGN